MMNGEKAEGLRLKGENKAGRVERKPCRARITRQQVFNGLLSSTQIRQSQQKA